jgi:prepilin-type N-terminal cleavage/methylation domain-containing protein
MKKSAFTLIELLVVIVIIGILATISVAQFNTYAAKARDAKRIQIVTTIAKILKYEDLDNFDEMKRYKVAPTELYQHLNNLGYPLDTSVGSYCFYFASTPYTNSSSYDDNQFIISTWGESTSTQRVGESGPIFAGSVLAEQNYKQLENIHHNSTNNYDDWIEGMDNWYECAVDRDALSNDGNGNNGIGSPHSTFYHGVSDLWDSRSYHNEANAAGKTYANSSWYTTQN